jgi:hypothetical protein
MNFEQHEEVPKLLMLLVIVTQEYSQEVEKS